VNVKGRLIQDEVNMRGRLKLKLKNKILFCICLLFLIGIIIICRVVFAKNNIYNNNEKIVKYDYSYNYTNRIGEGENSNDKIDIKYSGFYGTDTIWILESKEESEITFNYDSIVNSGDFKAVLINSQNEIENILEGTDQGNKTMKLAKGKYKFKLVGRNAEGKVKISIDKNKSIEVSKPNKR
jgi:uncharacterized protein YxeA